MVQVVNTSEGSYLDENDGRAVKSSCHSCHLTVVVLCCHCLLHRLPSNTQHNVSSNHLTQVLKSNCLLTSVDVTTCHHLA